MAASRLCIFLAVLVSTKMMAAQPIFGSQMWCDLMCDEDDDDDYSDGGLLDWLFGFDLDCSSCPPSKPTKSKTTTTAPGGQQPLSLMIPPANGMNVTLSNTGTSWLLNFMPWPFMSSATTAAAGSTTAAPTNAGSTAAGNGTAGNTTAKA